jgi:hypothetical protein
MERQIMKLKNWHMVLATLALFIFAQYVWYLTK